MTDTKVTYTIHEDGGYMLRYEGTDYFHALGTAVNSCLVIGGAYVVRADGVPKAEVFRLDKVGLTVVMQIGGEDG